MSDLLKKAKAIAALSHDGFDMLYFEELYQEWRTSNVMDGGTVGWGQGETPIDALAAAADAIGLTPDPAISGGLTEEEKEAIPVLTRLCEATGSNPYLSTPDQRRLRALLTRLTGGGA